MKRIFQTVALLIFTSIVTNGQSIELITPKGTNLTAQIDPEDKYYNFKVEGNIKNLTNKKLSIVWELEPLEINSEWFYTVCDANSCLQNTPTFSFELDGNQSALFEVGTITSGIAGKGKYKVSVYEEGKKASAIVKEYNFNISSPVGNDEQLMKSSVKVGPNPVAENLLISNTGNLNIQQIQLHNTQGSEIINKWIDFNNNDISLPMANLRGGLYLLTIKTQNGKYTKLITKE